MKFFYLLVFIFLLSVDAQRRSVKSELLSDNEPPPKSARRGRGRFVATSDAPQIEEKRTDPVSRRLASRRRPESHTEAPARRGYEVDEVIDEAPIETFRKYNKVKTLTETKFEAQNAPPSNTLFQPSTTENIDEIIKSIGSDITDTTFSSVSSISDFPTSLEPLSSELTSSELTKIDNEISRTPPETTTPITEKVTRKINGRSRIQSSATASTIASRARARTRINTKVEEQTSTPTAGRTVHRGSRRRTETPSETRIREPVASPQPRSRITEARTTPPPVIASAETVEIPRARSFQARARPPVATSTETAEVPTRSRTFHPRARPSVAPSADPAETSTRSRIEARTRGPSVISAAESVELPSRSRSGRRIPTAARRTDDLPPEKITIDLSHQRRGANRKVETTTLGSRFRTRFREVPPVIDEQKLEVLPLFERESKTVRPVRKFVSRRRNINSAEEVETSATENDVKLAEKPPKQSVVVETRTESSIRRRKLNIKPVTRKPVEQTAKPLSKASERTTKATVRTKLTQRTTKPTERTTKAPERTTKPTARTTKPTVQISKAKVQTSKPIIRESVVSEITEVTSKRTVTRSKAGTRNKVEIIKFVPRGSRKSEVNLTNVKKNKTSLSSSEEDIDDADNYPEPFKALIQAKKQTKESRSPQPLVTASPPVTKTTEKVVTSSPSTTTQVISSEANRQLEDSENELVPSRATPPTRRRFSQSTEKVTRPTRKSKFARSTTVAPLSTREHRFHAKFNTETEATSTNPVKSGSGFSSKPPRGLYSSRKTKESYTKNKSTTAQIPTPKKSNRYSSRYRNDASSRGAIRTSTNAPAYLPTIPTITPPTTSVKSSVAYQDKDLGVEVISFDDPVNTVPSANLVSGEYLASSTENHLTSPLVSASQTKTTEKPVSIIERIINSITAISTTEVPDLTKLTTPSQENQTKQSAILKLATKKSTKLDKVQTTQQIPLTVTSEKPTTIIERILSSLSAIQADNTTDTKIFKSKQVGTNFNTISSPSTTPLTRVTKSTLSAQFSTTVNPLYVLDEISNEQTLQKRTIDKLLLLLNTLTTPSAHPTPLVVVTPKTTSFVVGSSVATTTPAIESPTTTTIVPTTTSTTESTTSTTTEPATTTTTTTELPATTNQLFTSPSPNVSLGSRTNIPQTATTVRYTTTPTFSTLTTQVPTTTLPTATSTTEQPTLTSTEVVTTNPVFSNTTELSNEIEVNPLSIDSGVTSTPTDSVTPSGIDSSTISFFSTVTESATPSSADLPSTISSTLTTTEFAADTETNFVFPSTMPALINFEVSPGSVSVFNANDLSNVITPNDFPISAVTISGRTNFPEVITTTQSTTPSQTTTPISNSADSNATTQSAIVESRIGSGTTTTGSNTSESATIPPNTTPVGTTIASATAAAPTTGSTISPSVTDANSTPVSGTTTPPSTTVATATAVPTTRTVGTTISPDSPNVSTTLLPVTTDGATVAPSTTAAGTTINTDLLNVSTTLPPMITAGATVSPSTTAAGVTSVPNTTTAGTSSVPSTIAAASTTLAPTTMSSSSDNSTQDISSNIIDTTGSPEKSNETSTVSPSINITSRTSGRSGRLLNIVQDPVQNSIENSTLRDKDYFIFAVLNNNTILRKRPSRFPTKDTPYLVVGLLPNNTLVRKFPNGTLVPMEPVVRVSGFDTRENPPPLPEITSNQVTPDQGSRPDNKNLQTVEQNTIPPLEANPLSLSSVNNPSSTPGTTTSSAIPSVQANPLSISSTSSSTTTESSTSTSTVSSTSTAAPTSSTTSGTTTSSTAPTVTLPTLTEILNGKTVQAFNSIINISDLNKVQTLDVDPKTNRVLNADELKHKADIVFRWKPVTTPTYTFERLETVTLLTTLPTPTLSNRILDDQVSSTTFSAPTTIQQPATTTTATPTTTTTATPTTTPTMTTTTEVPTTTTAASTSTIPPTTTATFVSSKGTTVLPLSQPVTTTFRTTTFFPQFLTTLFSTLRPRRLSTEAPIAIVTPISNRVQSTTTPRVEINTASGDLLTAGSTRRTIRTTTEPTTTIFSTLPTSTVTHSRRRGTVPTTTQPTTTVPTTTFQTSTVVRNARRNTVAPITSTTSATKRLRELTEQQKKDLATLAQLEMEQAALLRQLSFLTNLNLANTKTTTTTDKNDLANRIIALAVERDKERQTTLSPEIPENKRQPKKISSSSDQTLEELVKQLNIATPSTTSTEYGKSNDAIIAALLKEQGIGPTTPKALEDIYQLTTTTRKPKTTTRRSGPLMQSLNWLLNVLAPPTTKRPKPKSRPKPKPKPKEPREPKELKEPKEEELLTHAPTHLTPVVTTAPRKNIVSSLSPEDVQKLIRQLEAIQRDPKNSQGLDFSKINSLQALINTGEGVKVTSSGTTGTTTRETTPLPTLTTTKKRNRVAKSTTSAPVSVSNSIEEDDIVSTTTKPRVTLPPVRLRPVPGIEESDTRVRGQLITAAVNVTRAISSFLGTALQGAATSFQSLLGSGSRAVGSLMQISSDTSPTAG